MTAGIELFAMKQLEKPDVPINNNELSESKEFSNNIENNRKKLIEPPDISYIEKTSRSALLEQCFAKAIQTNDVVDTPSEGLTEEEKVKIKTEKFK